MSTKTVASSTGPGSIVRTQLTCTSINRPELSSVRSCVVAEANSGRSGGSATLFCFLLRRARVTLIDKRGEVLGRGAARRFVGPDVVGA